MSNQSRIFNVPANGQAVTGLLGGFTFCYIRAATNPVEMSFNGNDWIPANLNDTFGPIALNPTRVYFRAVGGLASAITFDYGQTKFTAQSTSQKEASSYGFSSGFLPNNNPGNFILGVNNGNQRKLITFTPPLSGSYRIYSQDNHWTGVEMSSTSLPISWPTDHTYWVKQQSGAPAFQVYEIYYFNQ